MFQPQVFMPNFACSLLAAYADFCLFRLVRLMFNNDRLAILALLCYWLNWFQFFFATRTLMNPFETHMLLICLFFAPWPGDFVKNTRMT